ncbi:hypothetical protein KTD31_29320 [Burkholderia multivorans]|uniref:LPD7 domain-containing protein n=1 Tax=Burkholderia multivorans TaxID=87883 RepID=UPI001C24BDDC|nr:LPD7 domain-containing protein [Burkholderia multivorans]MBU9205465.1 hypothetical protein [Burkholderia multivorans]MCO8353474.1 hypothetical protein [Burkholderia multivorans]MCO8385733.1 hypothetical protein [Burkholderia multivorans]MCO8406586.1 hypothetical protein [Burkholderia multivorans]MCO8434829.1 hypothetical protein [Burkholderia multivorans]
MDGHEQVTGRGMSGAADRAADVVGLINSVERASPRGHATPDAQAVSALNPDDPSARLDWIDPDMLEALKRRRQRDLAAAREGMQAPVGASSGPAPARDAGALPQADSKGVPPAALPDTTTAGERQSGGTDTVPRAPSASTAGPLATPPDSVAKRFLQAGHRYFLRDGSREMAFEDRGARMVTAHNRPDIAESMAEMALAKGWSHIRVKGHEDFRRAVWMEAAVRGIGVTGYVPDERDRAVLAELMQARMINRIEQVNASRESAAAPADALAGAAVSGRVSSRQAVPEAGWTGQLIRHGAAPYQHEAGGTRSYFVTLRDSAGMDRTVWGVDLEGAMRASGAQPGQTVTLSNPGRQPVTVSEPVRDASGQVVGEQPKTVERNVWHVEIAGPDRASTPVNTSPLPPAATITSPPYGDRPRSAAPVAPLSPGAVAVDSAGWVPESTFQGELVAHGRAPYQNRTGSQMTCFATLREANGHQLTVWGADLERAIATGGVKEGDQVHLANFGRRRIDAEVPVVDARGDVTGTGHRMIERYVWRATASPREPHDRQPAAGTAPDDPQRTLHLGVIAEAMRAQGFSEKSVAKVQARAGEVMDRLLAQGVLVPAPRVFDPAGRTQQPRSRGRTVTPQAVPEVERTPQPATPAIPSR